MPFDSDSMIFYPSSALRLDMEYESTGFGKSDVEEKDGKNDTEHSHSNRRFVVTAEAQTQPKMLLLRTSGFALYYPPRQRKRWDDTETEPPLEWGDLFFDLFYVAATYNVSYIMTTHPNSKGMLYAAGTFFPIMSFWERKTYTDARFVFHDDLYHRVVKAFELILLGTAVLHINPYMMNADSEFSMFDFALTMTMARVTRMIKMAELYLFGVGQVELIRKSASGPFLQVLVLEFCFFFTATVVAGYRFMNHDDNEASDYDDSSYTSGYGDSEYSQNSTESHLLRFLAGSSDDSSTAFHVPIILMLVGYLLGVAYTTSSVIFCFPSGGRHKKINVPLHVDLVMHRFGEWVMLMLGESVFSLLIVDIPNEDSDFYVTFFACVMTVTMLYFLHFSSQPNHAHEHALRRSKNAGVLWGVLQPVYSMTLVSLGACFTFFLKYFADKESKYDSNYDTGSTYGEEEASYTDADGHYRFLAGGSGSHEDTKQAANKLFTSSLAFIFAALDCMTLLHLGKKAISSRCVCHRTDKFRLMPILFVVGRLSMVVFTYTLYLWVDEPRNLALIGMACVMVQLFGRRLGTQFEE